VETGFRWVTTSQGPRDQRMGSVQCWVFGTADSTTTVMGVCYSGCAYHGAQTMRGSSLLSNFWMLARGANILGPAATTMHAIGSH